MDLAAYIRENRLLPESVITDIITNHMIRKFTFFEELLENGANYDVTESTLLEWALAAGGPGYEVISSTKGFEPVNTSDYDNLGGVNNCISLKVMCIRRPHLPVCILTKRPDDSGLIVLLNKAFGSGKYSLGISTRAIWDVIHQADIEPLEIEAKALKLNKTIVGNSQNAERIRDSEARQIYNHIIKLGIERRASDIHLQPCEHMCNALYRIDGDNKPLMRIPNEILDRVANLLTVDGRVANKSPETPLDGKVHYIHPDYPDPKDARDLRFSILPARRGRDTNIRFLNNTLYTFEGLGMEPYNVEKYERILSMPQGFVVQVGPTGSGKSTTLYAGLRYIRENSMRNIITVEDPVEILMDGITQVDVNEKAGLTFARAARQFLRHDVDVGVIGEIRDEETALEAVRAATTGHLVVSSLHTNDSLGVLERLNRLNVDPYTLSEVLVAIMGQRLVRRLCPHCKEKYFAKWSDPEMKMFGRENEEGGVELYRPVGCEKCNNLGYRGRIAVNEILIVDRDLRDMIQRHETRKVMEHHLKDTGFQTMFQDALGKVTQGITSVIDLMPMYNDTLAYK